MWVIFYVPAVSISSIIIGIASLTVLASIFTGEPEETALPMTIIYLAVEVLFMLLSANEKRKNKEMLKSNFMSFIDIIRVAVCGIFMYHYFCEIVNTFNNYDGFFKWIFSGILGFFLKFAIGIFMGLGSVYVGTLVRDEYSTCHMNKSRAVKYMFQNIIAVAVFSLLIPIIPSIFD